MKIRFDKMHGCGNDYVYVNGADCAELTHEERSVLAVKLSDRHFGIGSDGLIFINPSKDYDFEMEMFNADGTRAEMCGNGIRCVAKYVYDHGMTDKEVFVVESMGVPHELQVTVQDGEVCAVKVDMGEPILEPVNIPVTSDKERFVDELIRVKDKEFKVTCVSMGNPHAVLFDSPELVNEYGPDFECHAIFPKRTNTEFVEIIDDENVRMRVYERGTGETLACGTGCSAVVVACVLNGKTGRNINVHVLGGVVNVNWAEDDHVYMTGPATRVFTGEIETDNLLGTEDIR